MLGIQAVTFMVSMKGGGKDFFHFFKKDHPRFQDLLEDPGRMVGCSVIYHDEYEIEKRCKCF